MTLYESLFPLIEELEGEFIEFDSWGDTHHGYLQTDRYNADGSLYIGLLTDDEGYLESWADMTVCLPDGDADLTHVYLDTNNFPEAEDIFDKYDLGRPDGTYGYSGFCAYPRYEVNMENINRFLVPTGENLTESLRVTGKAGTPENVLFDKLKQMTGLDINGSLFLVLDDTYPIKDKLRSEGARITNENGTWLTYFTDGDHGYNCEEFKVKDIVEVTEDYYSAGYGRGGYYPVLVFKEDFIYDAIGAIKDARDARKASKYAPTNPQEYLGNVGDHVEFEGIAKLLGEDAVGGYGWENYYRKYKITTPDGNVVRANVYAVRNSGGEEWPFEVPEGETLKWKGIVTEQSVDKYGNKVTKVKNLRLA